MSTRTCVCRSRDEVTLHTETTAAGAHVAVLHVPAAPRASVSLAITAGMRSEVRGEEGMMHLLERLLRGGGRSSTSMEYTEYYLTGEANRAQGLADRLLQQVFSPSLHRGEVEEAVEMILRQRHARLHRAPGRILPWPHLTRLHWSQFSQGHDGSGDETLRTRATPERLGVLHARHYRAANTVLAILTPHRPEETLARMIRSVEQYAPAPTPPTAAQEDGTPRVERKVHGQIGQGPSRRKIHVTDLSCGRESREGYLGEVILADLLGQRENVRASAGVFGPGEVAGDDVFVLVDDTARQAGPRELLGSARTAPPDSLTGAAHGAAHRWERYLNHDERRTRTLARDLAIRGSASFTQEVAAALKEIARDPARAARMAREASGRLAGAAITTVSIHS